MSYMAAPSGEHIADKAAKVLSQRLTGGRYYTCCNGTPNRIAVERSVLHPTAMGREEWTIAKHYFGCGVCFCIGPANRIAVGAQHAAPLHMDRSAWASASGVYSTLRAALSLRAVGRHNESGGAV